MTILRKIIDCQSFKNSEENVWDGVISVKLQACSVQIAHYFRKLFQKLVYLKEHFSKRLWCSIVLIECVPPVPKPELTLELTEEVMKIHPWWKLFFSRNASLEFIPCDFIKNELHHRDYLAWVLQGTFFNILENFLRGITVVSFIQEVITLLKGLGLVS